MKLVRRFSHRLRFLRCPKDRFCAKIVFDQFDNFEQGRSVGSGAAEPRRVLHAAFDGGVHAELDTRLRHQLVHGVDRRGELLKERVTCKSMT